MAEKNILLTGANRGLGFEILKELISRNHRGVIFAACRDRKKFNEAIKNLDLHQDTKLAFIPLDLNNHDSVKGAVAGLKKTDYKLDVLINNAAWINFQKDAQPRARETFQVNFYNTMLLTQELMKSDLLNNNGSIIFLSTVMGSAGMFLDPILGKCVKNSSFDDLMHFSNSIIKEIDDRHRLVELIKPDYPLPVYSLSKLFLNRYSELLSTHDSIKSKNISVYAVHPGWLQTSEENKAAPLKPSEGVPIVMWLMELSGKEGLSGKFVGRDKQVKPVWDPAFDWKANVV